MKRSKDMGDQRLHAAMYAPPNPQTQFSTYRFFFPFLPLSEFKKELKLKRIEAASHHILFSSAQGKAWA